MSWYDKTEMICSNCGKKYTTNISTLTIASQIYKRCPHCHENTGEVIKKKKEPSITQHISEGH